jgi:hypothetical protein
MKLEKIITLANKSVRLRFLAMERSLRATGCDLPLWVIPYDDHRFELPANAAWWTTGIRDWLRHERAHLPAFNMMFKYQCLNTANYQYVDSDIVFLKDPAKALAGEEGFVASCGHWRDTEETVNSETLSILKAKSTCWQRNVFNCGQFACDRVLYTEEELQRTCRDPRYVKSCLLLPYSDQPGLVLLTNLTGIPIHNLTLPPTCMESTWAEDYDEADNYEDYWRDETRKPYLIHWAGCDMWLPRTIDRLFTQYFSAAELEEWREEVITRAHREIRLRSSLRQRVRDAIRGVKAFSEEYQKNAPPPLTPMPKQARAARGRRFLLVTLP